MPRFPIKLNKPLYCASKGFSERYSYPFSPNRMEPQSCWVRRNALFPGGLSCVSKLSFQSYVSFPSREEMPGWISSGVWDKLYVCIYVLACLSPNNQTESGPQSYCPNLGVFKLEGTFWQLWVRTRLFSVQVWTIYEANWDVCLRQKIFLGGSISTCHLSQLPLPWLRKMQCGECWAVDKRGQCLASVCKRGSVWHQRVRGAVSGISG